MILRQLLAELLERQRGGTALPRHGHRLSCGFGKQRIGEHRRRTRADDAAQRRTAGESRVDQIIQRPIGERVPAGIIGQFHPRPITRLFH